ncbi:hypothetical protein GCM10011588_71660 [Nocardia jinanensis]|uniref:Uncharacterized protein n=1 Tax=Nocardia jinanensis TaxID=382504 RepID=A0A917VYR9_9NOCA|nr:hypothetical protein [Nocardia jinanensis]GGL46491.1 hypothetical protein GCM10011588_71660 [Nocardia jinanensis]
MTDYGDNAGADQGRDQGSSGQEIQPVQLDQADLGINSPLGASQGELQDQNTHHEARKDPGEQSADKPYSSQYRPLLILSRHHTILAAFQLQDATKERTGFGQYDKGADAAHVATAARRAGVEHVVLV